jgi:hypothetical protein
LKAYSSIHHSVRPGRTCSQQPSTRGVHLESIMSDIPRSGYPLLRKVFFSVAYS